MTKILYQTIESLKRKQTKQFYNRKIKSLAKYINLQAKATAATAATKLKK